MEQRLFPLPCGATTGKKCWPKVNSTNGLTLELLKKEGSVCRIMITQFPFGISIEKIMMASISDIHLFVKK
jgi:hypothetical protein